MSRWLEPEMWRSVFDAKGYETPTRHRGLLLVVRPAGAIRRGQIGALRGAALTLRGRARVRRRLSEVRPGPHEGRLALSSRTELEA